MTHNSLDVFSRMTSANNQINKKLDRTLGAVHGIGVSDFRVMQQLDAATGNTLSRIALAESVGLTASGITRLLNPMEKVGLVEKLKNERDARMSLVRLSKIGKQRYSEALLSFTQTMEASLNKLTQSEQKKLIELLEKMR